MAKMIPPQVSPSCRSPGEPDVFLRLKNDPSTSDWIVLHSLDIVQHETQLAGEADFVVIIPHKGILFLEIKACHSLKRERGLWFYGSTVGDPRGPFKQAAETMHSLRERLIRGQPGLSRVVFWSCVIFTHVPFREKSVEWHPWQVIDSVALRSAPISRLLQNVIDAARTFLKDTSGGAWFHPQSKEPYAEQCEQIAEFFRSDFEYLADYKSVFKSIEAELKHYTEEQFIALDAMETNRRVVFTGPAGTGKTILALEAARRASANSQTVLFLCFNRLLGAKLIRDCAAMSPLIKMRTLHGQLMHVAGSKVRRTRDDSPDFWENELPLLALEEMDESNVFDQIIIDEAQDILRHNYVDFLDLSVKGGLSSGNWKIFGDFEKQAIYGAANLSLDEFYSRISVRPAEYSLRVNCRNSPSVAALAEFLGALSPGYSRVLRPHDGVEPEYLYYDNREHQKIKLQESLAKLFSLGMTGKDIVVLSPLGDNASSASQISVEPWRERLKTFYSSEGGYIRYGSIHVFKGLEAPAVIVTDLESMPRHSLESLIYIAVTRALYRLILIMHESVKTYLLNPRNPDQ